MSILRPCKTNVKTFFAHAQTFFWQCGFMTIGSRVKAMRIAKGLKPYHLANAIGVSASTVSRIENGETKALKADTVLALAKALDCSPEWLNIGKGLPAAPSHAESLEETELVSIYKYLSYQNRCALMATARALLNAEPSEPSATNPFPKAKKIAN
jgi:transcriptional regulator with XRE-family HTH domain